MNKDDESEPNTKPSTWDQLATIKTFVCENALHPDYGFPILRRPTGPEILDGMLSYTVVNPDVSGCWFLFQAPEVTQCLIHREFFLYSLLSMTVA